MNSSRNISYHYCYYCYQVTDFPTYTEAIPTFQVNRPASAFNANNHTPCCETKPLLAVKVVSYNVPKAFSSTQSDLPLPGTCC